MGKRKAKCISLNVIPADSKLNWIQIFEPDPCVMKMSVCLKTSDLAEDLRHFLRRSVIYCTRVHTYFPWRRVTHRPGDDSHTNLQIFKIHSHQSRTVQVMWKYLEIQKIHHWKRAFMCVRGMELMRFKTQDICKFNTNAVTSFPVLGYDTKWIYNMFIVFL